MESIPYGSLRITWYKDVHIFVFDVSSQRSFDEVNTQYNIIHEDILGGGKDISKTSIVIGNKILSCSRHVSCATAQEWADERGLLYFEVDCAHNVGFSDTLEGLASICLNIEGT